VLPRGRGRKVELDALALTIALKDSHLTAQASQVRHKLLHVEQQAGVIWGGRGQKEESGEMRRNEVNMNMKGGAWHLTGKTSHHVPHTSHTHTHTHTHTFTQVLLLFLQLGLQQLHLSSYTAS
jgi:hypothetical protein